MEEAEAMDTSSDTPEAGDSVTIEGVDHPLAMDTSPILERRIARNTVRAPRNLSLGRGWLSTVQSTPLQTPHVQEEPLASTSTGHDSGFTAVHPSFQNIFPRAQEHNETAGIDTPPRIIVSQIIDLVSPSTTDEVSSENSLVGGEGEDISDGDSNHNAANDSVEHVEIQVPSTSRGHEAYEEDVTSESFAGTSNINPAEVRAEATTNEEDFHLEAASTGAASETLPLDRDGEQNVVSADVENLPLAQRIRSPDTSPLKNIPPPKKMKEATDHKECDSDGEDDGKLCPICFDAWTNSGDHRLVSLRCGHLFGQQCIKHWLQIHKANDRRCPQCKKKASLKDLRQLYACKIRVLDVSEQEALKATIKKLEEERDRLTRELAHERQLNQEAMRIQQEQQQKLQQLQCQGLLPHLQQNLQAQTSMQTNVSPININLLHRVEVSREGGCRVLAFNDWKQILVASQSSPNLFADYGIRMIDAAEFRLRQIMPLHSKAIRDLAFNVLRKDLLLSVSLDRTAKIFCMSSNSSSLTFNAELPLWSCCWDGDNSNIFFAGSQNGIVFQYDIRNNHTEVCRLVTQGDTAPVISLASVPAGDWLSRGGFFSCRLNRLHLYERLNSAEFNSFPIEIDGPFSALSYNHRTKCMLLSSRPTGQTPHAQHQLYQMAYVSSKPQYQKIHSLLGGTTQRVLSRPCMLDGVGKGKANLICAYQESEAHVAVWSAATGHKIPAGTLQCSEPVMDLCPLKTADQHLLATLSEKNLRVYQFS